MESTGGHDATGWPAGTGVVCAGCRPSELRLLPDEGCPTARSHTLGSAMMGVSSSQTGRLLAACVSPVHIIIRTSSTCRAAVSSSASLKRGSGTAPAPDGHCASQPCVRLCRCVAVAHLTHAHYCTIELNTHLLVITGSLLIASSAAPSSAGLVAARQPTAAHPAGPARKRAPCGGHRTFDSRSRQSDSRTTPCSLAWPPSSRPRGSD